MKFFWIEWFRNLGPWNPSILRVLSVEFGHIAQAIQCHLHVACWGLRGWTNRGQSRNSRVISLGSWTNPETCLQSIYHLFQFMALNGCLEGSSPLKPFCVSALDLEHVTTYLVVVPNSILAGWWLVIRVIGTLGIRGNLQKHKVTLLWSSTSSVSQAPTVTRQRFHICCPCGMLSLHSCHLRKATRIG